MNGYVFFRSLGVFYAIGGIILTGLGAMVWTISSQITRLSQYRSRLGLNWKAEYEKDYEPVSATFTRIGVCAVGIVLVVSITIWLFRILANKNGAASSRKTKARSRERSASLFERVAIYRRKALVRVYFGVFGIAFAVVLTVIPLGIFADFSYQQSLGLGVFVCSYMAVVSGCYYWLKAKALNEAIVFIAFMPLAILLVPFVRLIFVASPMLLPVLMVMAPITLVVVVLVLPDKSGISTRTKPRW